MVLAGLGALLIGASGLACGGDEGSISPGAVDTFDYGFEPQTKTVEVGETVTWTNTGELIHNVKGKGFFSKAIDPGGSYEFTFERAGSFDYLCTLHPTQMSGTVVVE